MKKWVTFTIVEAENLPIGDSNGFSDPYVTVEYYPGNQRLLKTSVKQKTLNPKWVC
jgi:Ca2+-dependent lipid-binding protein